MIGRSIVLGALVVLWAVPAGAQGVYKWKDAKGQWHFSQTPPSGVGAKEVKLPKPAAAPLPPAETPQSQEGRGEFPSPVSAPQTKRPPHWVFILPDDTIMGVFDNNDACQEYKALVLSESKPKTEKAGSEVEDTIVASRCLPSDTLKPSTQEPNVIVVSRRLIPDPVRVAHYTLEGEVLNRGAEPASDVVLRYEVTRTGGIKVGQGKAAVTPNLLSKGEVGTFKTQILGIPSIDSRNLSTEAGWAGH